MLVIRLMRSRFIIRTKGDVVMEDKEYIKSLENLLIFMCQTYDETQKELMKLYKEEGNEACFKVPMIQGTANVIPISQIGQLEFERPSHGFSDVFKEIEQKRIGE